MDAFDLARLVYSTELEESARRLLYLRTQDYDYSGFVQLLTEREDLIAAGRYGFTETPQSRDILAPLYLGFVAPSGKLHDTSVIHAETAAKGREYFTISKSRGPDLWWNEEHSLTELKALLLYAHEIVMFDPFDDFIDAWVRAALRRDESAGPVITPDYSLVADVMSIQDGRSRHKGLLKSDRPFLVTALARLLFFLARIEPMYKAGVVRFIPRPAEASLGLVREVVARKTRCAPTTPTEQLPRAEVRAQIQARTIAQSINYVDAFSRSPNEIERVRELLDGKIDVGDKSEMLRMLSAARLPNLDVLRLKDIAEIREYDTFGEWRALLRHVISAQGQHGDFTEAVRLAERVLTRDWSATAVGASLSLAVTSIASAWLTSPTVAAVGLTASAAGLGTELTSSYLHPDARATKRVRRHLVTLKGATLGRPLGPIDSWVAQDNA